MRDASKIKPTTKSLSELSVTELLGSLKAAQLWSTLGGLAVLLSAAFALGAKFCKLFGG
jgi:hypothetical protein